MTYEVFYQIGEYADSIIIEGENIEEVREKAIKELESRDATYSYSNWLND